MEGALRGLAEIFGNSSGRDGLKISEITPRKRGGENSSVGEDVSEESRSEEEETLRGASAVISEVSPAEDRSSVTNPTSGEIFSPGSASSNKAHASGGKALPSSGIC